MGIGLIIIRLLLLIKVFQHLVQALLVARELLIEPHDLPGGFPDRPRATLGGCFKSYLYPAPYVGLIGMQVHGVQHLTGQGLPQGAISPQTKLIQPANVVEGLTAQSLKLIFQSFLQALLLPYMELVHSKCLNSLY